MGDTSVVVTMIEGDACQRAFMLEPLEQELKKAVMEEAVETAVLTALTGSTGLLAKTADTASDAAKAASRLDTVADTLDNLSDAERALDKIRDVEKIDDVTDAVRDIDRIDDLNDALKATEKVVEGGRKTNDSQLYLQRALKNQGLDVAPNRLKETWIEGDYKYTVRIHEGNTKYTDASSIYRVSRQSTILDANGQGTGLEYLGTDGNWYRQSVLTEFFKGGTPNPDFNENAARITHIAINGGN